MNNFFTPPQPNRQFAELTRQELYDLIWSTPASKLSVNVGISDVAIAKRCKRLDVPRPPRGYWAKVEAGKKPQKPPLPPTREEAFAHAALQPVGKVRLSPGKNESLHPLAGELFQAITATKLDGQKRASIRERTLPEVSVSKDLAERVTQAFHAILSGVEALGIVFRKGQGYGGGFFQKGHDRLYLDIEEVLVEPPPDAAHRRRSSWQGQTESRVPSGRLTFSLQTERYGARDAKRWTEGEKAPLEDLLAEIVTEIRRHFAEAQKRRAKEAIEAEKLRVENEERHKKWQAEEAIRREDERKRRHAEASETVMKHRKDDLLKAAEWWRLHRVAEDFIAACEQRWRDAQGDQLKPEQEEWLQWARKTAETLSPFATGFPEPEKDGTFSPLSVPTGGPSPETREFSRPPTMPEIPGPVVVQQGYGASSHESTPKPYPFWLKYRR